jgi:hypothetical protein
LEVNRINKFLGVSLGRRGYFRLLKPKYLSTHQKAPIEKLYSRISGTETKQKQFSGFVRRAGIDGERVYALGHPGAKGIIHEAMARNSGQSRESGADDAQVEVGAGARAGVARVGGAVVHQLGHTQGAGLSEACTGSMCLLR